MTPPGPRRRINRETLRRVLAVDLARLEHSVESRALRRLLRNLRIIVHVLRALVQGKHSERAAALTYFSLLALVPLVAVIFSLFKAFGAMARAGEQVKHFLFGYLVESSQGQVAAWLDGFVESFNAGAVGGVGMGALLVTLLLTLSSVEEALNRAWGVRSARGWGMRLVVYWSVLTVGPVLLGGSLAITAALHDTGAAAWARAHVPLLSLQSRLVPVLLTCAAFSSMYLIVPSARVRLSAALTGGTVAGVLFEVFKQLYAYYTARALAGSPLYGSLAALPLFVVWLNYSWRIVLFGADVAHAVQYASTDPTEETDPRTNQQAREEAAVRIAQVVARAFAAGQPPPSPFDLSIQVLLPAHLTETLCQHLLAAGLFREVAAGRRTSGFVPGRPLEELSAADIVRVLRCQVGVGHFGVSGDAKDLIERTLADAEADAMRHLAALRWSDLARGELPPLLAPASDAAAAAAPAASPSASAIRSS